MDLFSDVPGLNFLNKLVLLPATFNTEIMQGSSAAKHVKYTVEQVEHLVKQKDLHFLRALASVIQHFQKKKGSDVHKFSTVTNKHN